MAADGGEVRRRTRARNAGSRPHGALRAAMLLGLACGWGCSEAGSRDVALTGAALTELAAAASGDAAQPDAGGDAAQLDAAASGDAAQPDAGGDAAQLDAAASGDAAQPDAATSGDAAQPDAAISGDAALPSLQLDAMAPADADGGAMPMADAGQADDGPHMRCPMHMTADPRDDTVADVPSIVWFGRSRDVLMPQPIIDWMDEQALEDAHNAWHLTRRWDEFCNQSFASGDNCDFAAQLRAQSLWRADMQQAAPGAGRAFLAMHRHMIGMLKAAFPKHTDLLRGFSHVPRTRRDPENPTPWKTPSWTDDNVYGFDVLEHIEDHLDLFPDEDALGNYIETATRWTPEVPVVASNEPGSGVHAAMHVQWSVSASSGDLGRFDTALRNFTFWKLHGFIDDVWQRYRAALGLSDDDPAYMQAIDDECYLMYELEPANRYLHTP